VSSDLLRQALPGSTLVVAIDPGEARHRVWFSTGEQRLLEEPRSVTALLPGLEEVVAGIERLAALDLPARPGPFGTALGTPSATGSRVGASAEKHRDSLGILQAGVPMKVVSEQLGHSSLAITADTYTSVLPAVAHAAAQASRARCRGGRGRRSRKALTQLLRSLADRLQSDSQEGSMNDEPEGDQAKGLVRGGAPSGTRTPNPLIKSQLLCLLS
jgi:hypothetical protein